MRVLMTTDAVGGVWDYSLALAGGLARRGVAVELAVLAGPLSSDARRAAARIAALRVCESRFRLVWMEDPWRDLARARRWLRRLADRFRPDIVHVNDFGLAVPWREPSVVVGHSCVLSWWEAVHRAPAPPAWSRYRAWVREGLAAADAVVAPTRAMRDALRRHYGLRGGLVIRNGSDARGRRPRAKLPFVLGAGRLWDPAKGADTLAEAAPHVPWPVALAGADVPPGGRGGSGAADGALHRLGRLPSAALGAWMGHAALFAHPARYEPFGLCVLEAAQSGCALVLGEVPSLRELWDGAAEFVPPGDAGALGAALRALIGAPARRRELAAAARRRARRYTRARMVERHLALYARLAGAAPAAAWRRSA